MSENIAKPLDKEQIRFILRQIENTNYEDIPQVLKQLFRYLDEVGSFSKIYKEYIESGEEEFNNAYKTEEVLLDYSTWHLPDDINKAKIFSFYVYFAIAEEKFTIEYLAYDKYESDDYRTWIKSLNQDLMPYFAKALEDIENDCITFDSAEFAFDKQSLLGTNIYIYGAEIQSLISSTGKVELTINEIQNYSGLDSDELKAILLALHKEISGENKPEPSLWKKLKGMAPATAAMLFKFVLENHDKIKDVIEKLT